MQLATEVINSINKAIEADQGTAYRAALKTLLPKMSDAYQATSKAPYRRHLGVSILGDDCARKLWYGFRWAKHITHDGRLIRLFNRGHLEEAHFIAMLSIIAGVKVYFEDDQGGQYKFKLFNGHSGSAIDGVATGLPGFEDKPTLLEFKTSANKGFVSLTKNGIQKEKWQHFVQTQLYMHNFELEQALYLAVNKDNDHIHAEKIIYDQQLCLNYLDKAESIIFSDRPPKKINNSKTFWKCRFCDYSDVCHDSADADKNCRTCTHSRAEHDGTWSCYLQKPDIGDDRRFTGCADYELLSGFRHD